MKNHIDYKFDLKYNIENVENQIILWKIDNYSSYLINFSTSDNNNIVTFSTLLEGNDVLFTYNVNERKIKADNLTNQDLLVIISLLF